MITSWDLLATGGILYYFAVDLSKDKNNSKGNPGLISLSMFNRPNVTILSFLL